MKRLSAAGKILFVNLLDDPGPDRLVAEIGRRGVECEIVAGGSSFAARTRFARRVYPLPDFGGAPLRAFVLARRLDKLVEQSAPDLIVPLDELAAGVLRDARLLRRVTPKTRRLLVASLGAAEKFCAARSRGRLAALAADLGLRTPRTAEIADLAAARRAAGEFGFPLVLKRELTAGGGGVLIVRDDHTLARAFRRSQFLARAKAQFGFIEGFRGETVNHVAQEFIAGDLVFRNSACRDGVELAGVNFMAERHDPFDVGPSQRIRCVENAEMARSTRAVIEALGMSGFVSLDFIVDAQGRAHLLELNSRPTGSTHLGKFFGADLIAALLGSAPETGAEAPQSIALFPKAIDGDPFDTALWGSPGLLHDVPWEDPELLDDYARWLSIRHPQAGRQFAELRATKDAAAVESPQWRTPLRLRSRTAA